MEREGVVRGVQGVDRYLDHWREYVEDGLGLLELLVLVELVELVELEFGVERIKGEDRERVDGGIDEED